MASREALRQNALRALQAWPKDPLRPTAQLGAVLAARLAQTPPVFPGKSGGSSSNPEEQVGAARALLAGRFQARYAPDPTRSASGGLMTPRGCPGYYEALVRDLDQVPTRSWAGKLAIRLKGMIRWS